MPSMSKTRIGAAASVGDADMAFTSGARGTLAAPTLPMWGFQQREGQAASRGFSECSRFVGG
ncbi:hypothetical protein GCM10007904_03340 [Oharaeibacter diazotrophicus]|nr:hypothetical protein GCM10007904_03340 [Oharaeibacter diazotrophicus]